MIGRAGRVALGGAALAAVMVAPAMAMDVAADKAAVDREFAADWPHLEALYKDIHSHPEIAFQEQRTAALLAKEMRALGFEVTEHVGKTGIVAIYHNGPGPVVMVRTELDALPVKEKTGLPWASTVKIQYEGHETVVAHACGHDIHMAAWVGTAKALLAMKDKWHGTLMFIGQPAEEAIGGAKAMLDDGLFTRFPKPADRLRPARGERPLRHDRLQAGDLQLQRRQLHHQLQRARRPRLHAQRDHRPGGGGRALRHRRADRGQPRARAAPVRRDHRRGDRGRQPPATSSRTTSSCAAPSAATTRTCGRH